MSSEGFRSSFRFDPEQGTSFRPLGSRDGPPGLDAELLASVSSQPRHHRRKRCRGGGSGAVEQPEISGFQLPGQAALGASPGGILSLEDSLLNLQQFLDSDPLPDSLAEQAEPPDPSATGSDEPQSDYAARCKARSIAWTRLRPHLMQAELQQQIPPAAGTPCGKCSQRTACILCGSCDPSRPLCGPCDAAEHPFAHEHRRLVWSQGFLQPISPTSECDGAGIIHHTGVDSRRALLLIHLLCRLPHRCSID